MKQPRPRAGCSSPSRTPAVRTKFNESHPDGSKITVPALTGDGKVDRAHRAAANRTEWSPVFYVTLCTSAAYGSPVAAAIAGAVYCKGSSDFVKGYTEAADKRGPGFYISLQAQMALLGMSAAGMACCVLKDGFGFDVMERVGANALQARVWDMVTGAAGSK